MRSQARKLRQTVERRDMIALLKGGATGPAQALDALDRSLAMIEFDLNGTILSAN